MKYIIFWLAYVIVVLLASTLVAVLFEMALEWYRGRKYDL